MKSRSPSGRDDAPHEQETHGLVYGYIAERAKRWLDDDLKRTRAGLARNAGLRIEQVHELLNGDRKPTQRAMRAVARAVGIEFDDLEASAATWAKSSARPGAKPTPSTTAKTPARRPSRPSSERDAASTSNTAISSADRYPNRVRALQAAQLLDHDPRDIETVRAVVLPPGTTDPAPRAWITWIDRAREERLQMVDVPRRPRQRRTP